MQTFFRILYWVLAGFNSRSYQYSRRDPAHPEPEGEIYFIDPFALWLSFIPIAVGLLMTLGAGWQLFVVMLFVSVITFLLMFRWRFLPILVGIVLMIVGYFVGGWSGAFAPFLVAFGLTIFAYMGYNAPPQTLVIRKFLAGPEFFLNTPVLVADFMEWETIPGLQFPMRSDGQSPNSIRSMMKLVAGPQDARDTDHDIDSHVDIRFSGSILFRIDLNRPFSVMQSFFDDFRLRPKDDEMTDQEDLEERCNRLFRTIVVGACDTILQKYNWEVAVQDIATINLALEMELPHHLHDFPIIVQKVLLEEAFGEPITQRNRQAAARLEATTAGRTALADRDRRQTVATANADAVVTESEQDRRARLAQTEANLAAALAEQKNARRIAGQELKALELQTETAAKRAQIEFASLAARLRAIGQEPLAAAIDGLTGSDPALRVPVYNEFAKSLGTAPAVGTAVTLGSKLDTFAAPAIIDAGTRLLEIFEAARRVSSQQTPPVSPTAPPTP